MFRPQDFFAVKSQKTMAPNSKPHQPISIDKLANQSKSKWDQQLIIPEVLYSKFNIAIPQGQLKRQDKTYPPSLIDYIKRAYARCRNQSQSKIMEGEIRKVLSKYSQTLNTVKWETLPLPQISVQINKGQLPKQKKSSQVNIIKKGQIKLPPSYKIVDEDKPSKAMLLAQKKLEKLQQKLKNQKQQEARKQQTKAFIGFRSQIQAPTRSSHPIRKIQFPKPSVIETKNTSVSVVQSKQKREAQTTPNKKQTKPQVSKKITKKEMVMVMKSKQDDEKTNLVAKRYAEFNKLRQDNYQKHETNVEDDNEVISEKIVGKSNNIDKPYLRITGRPNPDTVRPQNILKKALKHFLDMYKKGCNYEQLISQLRSIRQDLTVQDIKNSFTVQVYEQNFKISLFENDVAQFKHLQTRLWQLYCQGLFYTKQRKIKFVCYQLIALILQQKNHNLEYVMTQLPPEQLLEKDIQSCLQLRKMLMIGNYRGFFDFYNSCDHITRCLLNHYIDKVRMQCLVMVCRTCGEKISLKNLSQLIAEDQDVLEALIKQQGGILKDRFLMLKASYEKFMNSEHLVTKKVTTLLD